MKNKKALEITSGKLAVFVIFAFVLFFGANSAIDSFNFIKEKTTLLGESSDEFLCQDDSKECILTLKNCDKEDCSNEEQENYEKILATSTLNKEELSKLYGEDFVIEVENIASRLGTDAKFLMTAMAFETGGTFSPSIQNSQSGAIGLIQFTDIAIERINKDYKTSLTKNKLKSMTRVEQLEYVEKYLNPYKGQLDSIEDVYMAILWPDAVGKGSSYEIFSRQIEYDQNKGLDVNNDGKITVAEATQKVTSRYPPDTYIA